ncbi:LOW QUALITY PROTEIN: wall-associated receptor kinase-like 22 [Actinidia eriantha]|uniref:LOW QUALITY PROTEIN: wall-associated receptor kinase-like 22 n=1 Tax=Actinidia eriantha TaxID=165200 RepID=UPI00258AAA92|nr:LOW QUALITY PROTEIN: wall-associated receptor kinase-like 22 [Actinidia eriantha]
MVPIILWLWLTTTASVAASPQSRPGCQESCGNVVIPYPFGIGANCSFDEGFVVTCNDTFNPPKPFIKSMNLEVLQISINGTVQVNNPVITSNCPGRTNGLDLFLEFPFSFSDTYNRFTAMGCNNLALITRQDTIITGCMSICNVSSTLETGCFGISCCQTTIPPFLKFINASLRSIDPNKDQNDCKYAFMVDHQWFRDKDIYAARDMEYVPAVLDWTINGTCINGTNSSTGSFCGANAYCSRNQTWSSRCYCESGYEGNPYLSSGCQDIDECAEPSLNRCERFCLNTPGGYNCSCPGGYLSFGYSCLKLPNNNSRTKVIVLGTCSGLGVLLLLLGGWWLRQEVNRRKETKLKEKFFKRNGGLLLQQQLLSDKGNLETAKLFTSKELEKATDNYNRNRILGHGGQGTVYKGMLTDGRIVAIKKSKILDEGKLGQFINEVVILSQVNHRNVVKLIGCCLETEVPMLVYEFIPNGTLFHYIREQNEEFPLSWDLRLRIASEVAGALSYLHSAAAIPIYHRDIKSTNILLDEKYRAKVSDFGISRSISQDQTHLTTKVQGTFGYLDPEYFQSSQFTDKSDVYSFGVVLVELLTGEKPILPPRLEECRSLASHFILSMEENRLFDILDSRVRKEGGKEEILAVANLANRCLDLNGKKRPTMREIVIALDRIRLPNDTSTIKQRCKEEEGADEFAVPWEAASTSTDSFFGVSVSPTSTLLFKKSS